MQYANASQILPEELLDQIRQYFPGGMLFVPKESLDRKERASLVVQLVEKNVPVSEVAELAGLSQRHVRRLLQGRLRSRGTGADKV